MPAGDRTGPEGMGSGTGRGAGYCAGHEQPGFENMAFARGYHRGRMHGNRRSRRLHRYPMHPGWGRRGYFPGDFPAPAPMTEEQEQEALKAEEAWLQEKLDAVRSQIKKEE